MSTYSARVVLLVYGILIGLCLAVLGTRARAQGTQDWWRRPAVVACCSIADACWADDYRITPEGVTATVTGGGPKEHEWCPVGHTYIVADGPKILDEPGNPTNRPMIFLNAYNLDHVYCFALGPLI